MSKPLAPVLFVSHGAPTFALEPGVLGPALASVGQRLDAIEAVLVVSPHWQTRQISVMVNPSPATVHDFGGFPSELYQLQYPAKGHETLAREAARLLDQAGLTVLLDTQRGLDHGAWVPLYHLLPQADVPVFQVSLPVHLNTEQTFKLGQVLAPLREKGVLILGSGSMTHNLQEYFGAANASDPYAQEFADWVRTAVRSRSLSALRRYRQEAPHAARAHPTEEHFLPLLLAMGASTDADALEVMAPEIGQGILSMESYAWGMRP